jgi:hypothetical protein
MNSRRRFPLWFWFVYAGVNLWHLTLPAAGAFLLVGWFGADWLGPLRWAAFAAAALLAMPFPAASVLYVVQTIVAATYWRKLAHEETLAGVALPAGSRIRFNDRAHTELISVDLPHATELLGLRVVGRLARYERWDDVGPVWSGTLADDQSINGVPCRGGEIASDKFGTIFDTHGVAHRFELAGEHAFFGLTFPPGTVVGRGSTKRPWHFRLPVGMGVHIPALATTAPPGVTLTIAPDGRLEEIDSGHGQTIVVCGVPLNSKNFRVNGDQVVSELAQPFVIDGRMLPEASGVVIELPTGRAYAISEKT